MFSPLETSLLSAVVTLIGILVTVFVMKGNADARYVTKDQCSTERQLQCSERAAVRDQLDSLKRTMRIALNMNRALVAHSDMPDATKAKILNNDGGPE